MKKSRLLFVIKASVHVGELSKRRFSEVPDKRIAIDTIRGFASFNDEVQDIPKGILQLTIELEDFRIGPIDAVAFNERRDLPTPVIITKPVVVTLDYSGTSHLEYSLSFTGDEVTDAPIQSLQP
jgi:hypothetical protein